MRIGQRDFDFPKKTYVMGILNVTPDSFSDGGHFIDSEKAADRALQMEAEGADLIDVGGESTRPGSRGVSVEEERARVLPVLRKIIPRLRIPVSLDTQKSAVAHLGLDEGVSLINDVSALRDPEMAAVVAGAGVPVILMHMRGEPRTMQENISYQDVVQEVRVFLKNRIEWAVDQGISRNKILIDPGIGFGKEAPHNLELLRHLEEFQTLEAPIVIGLSKKRFLREMVGVANPTDASAVLASAVASAWAAKRGAAIVRVHDVAQTVSALKLLDLFSGTR